MYLYVLKTLLLLVINSLLARVAILAPGLGSGPSLEGAKNISQLADSPSFRLSPMEIPVFGFLNLRLQFGAAIWGFIYTLLLQWKLFLNFCMVRINF